MSKLAISVDDLSKKYGTGLAVSHAKFEVPIGTICGFVGPNGAGKTTTIRMLLGLISPTGGSGQILGEPITSPDKYLPSVGAMIEGPAFYPALSGSENLRVLATLGGFPQERVDQLLKQVGLADRGGSKYKTYSLGMKQRLGIAAALLPDPKLLILDEPTNGLDPQGIADIRNLILHLSREQGKTVLVSSHLLSEIEQVATRLIIIDKGCKLVEGDSKELFDTSKTVVAIQTLDNKQATELLLQSSWAKQVLVNRSTDKEIFMQLDEKYLPNLHKNLVEMGIGVLSVKPMHSLEDYFLQITSTQKYV